MVNKSARSLYLGICSSRRDTISTSSTDWETPQVGESDGPQWTSVKLPLSSTKDWRIFETLLLVGKQVVEVEVEIEDFLRNSLQLAKESEPKMTGVAVSGVEDMLRLFGVILTTWSSPLVLLIAASGRASFDNVDNDNDVGFWGAMVVQLWPLDEASFYSHEDIWEINENKITLWLLSWTTNWN